jgi:CBS domain-containing protein
MSIFVDMRHVFGDVSLFNLIQSMLFRIAEKKVIFIKMLEEALRFRVPIGFGGRLITERLDLKKHAIAPVVIPVRALSFGFNVKAKNTVERIDELVEKGAISRELAANLKASYIFLKRVHFVTQVSNAGKAANINELDLRELPKLRVEFIRDSLRSISEFHRMMGMRFL